MSKCSRNLGLYRTDAYKNALSYSAHRTSADDTETFATQKDIMIKEIVTALFAAYTLIACQAPVHITEADLVLRGGEVYTLDEKQSWAEAIAIGGDKIIAVGSYHQISAYISETTRIMDLKDAMVLPGFHDAHTHPLEGGFLQQYCDLSEIIDSVAAITAKIKICADDSEPGWLIGFDIDLSLFPQNGPDRALLDTIAPERLTFLDASDGHSVWVNQRCGGNLRDRRLVQ